MIVFVYTNTNAEKKKRFFDLAPFFLIKKIFDLQGYKKVWHFNKIDIFKQVTENSTKKKLFKI